MSRIVETALVGSSGRPDRLPEPSFPEVAFAGRSNVGKSSLLNKLSGRRNLFEVSRTPGRTRTVVHVEARLYSGARLYLVDLPGFGYARVSHGARESWARTIETYLLERETLHLVVVLVDARRGPQEEEAELFDFLADAGRPALLAATKLDRVKNSRRVSAIRRLEDRTGVPVIGTSAVTGRGVDRLLAEIASRCAPGG